MLWALERVGAALGARPVPSVLLKGAAYIGQDCRSPPGVCRRTWTSSCHERIWRTRRRVFCRGRLDSDGLDDHDQRYYQEWSHEVPPMRHPLLAVELDLHHNILPPVARTLWMPMRCSRLASLQVAAWQVLAPADQVLHSAAHLFCDSELRDRIRDLVDLDGLLRHFGRTPGFLRGCPCARRPGACRSRWRWPAISACTGSARRFLPTCSSPSSHRPGRSAASVAAAVAETALMPTEPDDDPRRRNRLAATVLLARYHRQAHADAPAGAARVAQAAAGRGRRRQIADAYA